MAPPALTALIPPATDVKLGSTIKHTLVVSFSDLDRGAPSPALRTAFEDGVEAALTSVFPISSKRPLVDAGKPIFGREGIRGFSMRLHCNEEQSRQLQAAASSTGRLACSTAAGINFDINLQLPSKRSMQLRLSGLPLGLASLGKDEIAVILSTAGMTLNSMTRVRSGKGFWRGDVLDVDVTAAEPIPTRGPIMLKRGAAGQTHRIHYTERMPMLPPASKLLRVQQQQQGRGKEKATTAASHGPQVVGGHVHAAASTPETKPPPAASALPQQQAPGSGKEPAQQHDLGGPVTRNAAQDPAAAAGTSGPGVSNDAPAAARDATAGASCSSTDGLDGPAWANDTNSRRARRAAARERKRVEDAQRAIAAAAVALSPSGGNRKKSATHHAGGGS